MVFKIFAREGCSICTKAREVLNRFQVPVEVCYVDGPNGTVDNLADLAWFDWTDTPPLVVATDGERVLARWVGEEIGDPNRSWHRTVAEWLAGQQVNPATTPESRAD